LKKNIKGVPHDFQAPSWARASSLSRLHNHTR